MFLGCARDGRVVPPELTEDGFPPTGPETIGHGVHRIPLPLPNDGLRAVNVYVLEQDDGPC